MNGRAVLQVNLVDVDKGSPEKRAGSSRGSCNL